VQFVHTAKSAALRPGADRDIWGEGGDIEARQPIGDDGSGQGIATNGKIRDDRARSRGAGPTGGDRPATLVFRIRLGIGAADDRVGIKDAIDIENQDPELDHHQNGGDRIGMVGQFGDDIGDAGAASFVNDLQAGGGVGSAPVGRMLEASGRLTISGQIRRRHD